MAIPVTNLTIWSKLYDPQTAQAAHLKVREVIQKHLREEVRGEVHDFLQGSYRNHTSIYQDSDVDLVLRYDGICDYDFSALTFNDQIRALAQVPQNPTGYSYAHYRWEVVKALIDGFLEEDVDLSGKKSIKVKGVPGQRFHADVIPCIQYRRYTEWTGDLSTGFVPGIALWTTDTSRRIVNYPQQHIINGWEKNDLTDGNFKPTVRLYKNLRNVAVNRGCLEEGVAPSYFIECLLWNADNDWFDKYARSSFGFTLTGLLENLSMDFRCQNDQLPLFDPAASAPEQWTIGKAYEFLTALLELYRKWV